MVFFVYNHWKKVGETMDDYQFEKKLGIQTIVDEPATMHLVDNHSYEPTAYSVLELLANEVEIQQQDYFVDFGSGKGRVAIYANYRWGIPVTGVEYDALYVEVANMNRYLYCKKHGEKDITFHHTLAQNYRIKQTDSIFFFFNPFSPAIFETVLKNINASYDKHPRHMKIIVYFPMFEYIELLDWSPFQFIMEILMPPQLILSPNDRLLIYERQAF